MNGWTNILYARPSFLEGLARVFDLVGTLNNYNYGSSPAAADAHALTADWRAVGDDIQSALKLWLEDDRNREFREYMLDVKVQKA